LRGLSRDHPELGITRADADANALANLDKLFPVQ
jgi:hypothetical protein